MRPVSRHDPSRARWAGAALALALLLAGGRAWAQAAQTPPAPAAPPAAGAPEARVERAAALVRSGAFEETAAMLRELLSADPGNRALREWLAFALESMGDLAGEREVRSALATDFPDDPGVQADYGRVLERSGEDDAALRAYRRARELSPGRPAPELDAAVARERGRTAVEVGTPVTFMSDPEATASGVQAGAAVPAGSGRHLVLLGTRAVANQRNGGDAAVSSVLAATFVRRGTSGASWSAGPRLHLIAPRGSAPRDLAAGGAIAGRTPSGPRFQAEAKAEFNAPWDEAAVALLHGGRSTSIEGHAYAHGLARRLLLQAGARTRELSILAPAPGAGRPEARQSLWLAGADLVAWRKPGAAMPGEMLDEALIAPASLSSALTLAYRHYDVSTRPDAGFATVIGVVPRGRVDETSVVATVASPRTRLGLEIRAGLARDRARPARMWRAGGALTWAPWPATRFGLGYDGATEVATGLIGRRRAGWLSVHVDL
jgi:tetratricopeptide (TPR) repeat protein